MQPEADHTQKVPEDIRKEGFVVAHINDYVEPFSQEFGNKPYIESGVAHHIRNGLVPGGEEGKIIRKRMEDSKKVSEEHVIK